ncbi:PRD domain-containing protein [Lactobacillus delbrueckii]|uniref:PRD domain-containing protein n=1 Tax=Lactobacillus delbrueckii TaxID=1584 RepID=UPI0039C15B5E
MLLKIVQVLNNNVAVVEDHGGRLEIVMGTGLAFGKKKGDAVEDKKVEATFKMHDEHAVDDLSTLLKDVPADFIEASYSLIEQSQEKYDFAVEGYLYMTLTMHLYSAYQRLKEGRYRANNSLPDLSDKYPEAYKIADEFLAGFKERLRVDFPASECDSIALHFINAHGDQASQAEPVDRLDEQILAIVSDVLRKNSIVRNSVNYTDYGRFMAHLTYLAQRLREGRQSKDVQISAMSLVSISRDFPNAKRIVDKIAERLKYELKIEVSDLERLYLLIHVVRLSNENGTKK